MAIDYAKVNALSGEAQQIQSAIDLLQTDGRIVQMMISGSGGPITPPPEGGPPMSPTPLRMVSVRTEDIAYPPQMVNTIIAALKERYQKVSDELAQLLTSAGTRAAQPRKPA